MHLPCTFRLGSSLPAGWMLQSERYGGYSSVAERRSVAADVVGSTPTGRPNPPTCFLSLLKDFQAGNHSGQSPLAAERTGSL